MIPMPVQRHSHTHSHTHGHTHNARARSAEHADPPSGHGGGVRPISSPPPGRRSHRPAANHRGARHAADGRVRERGAVATELVIAIPVLLLIVMTVVQFAVAAHARHVAQAVAAQAATAARVQGATAADGQTAGRSLLAQLGSTLVDATIEVRRGPDQVTVTGHAETLVPGLRLPVTASGGGPVERIPASLTPTGGTG